MTEPRARPPGSGPFSWLPAAALASIPTVTSDGVMVVDGRGVILQANPALGRLCGRAPDEFEGASLDLLVEDAAAMVGRVDELMETGEVWVGRTTLRRRDGAFVECDTWLGGAAIDSGPVLVCLLHEVGVRRRYGTTEIDEVEARVHELVNSLAGLRGYVQLLGRSSGDDQGVILGRLEALANTTSDRLEHLLEEISVR